MVSTQLIDYIKTEEARGYSAHQLHDYLLKKGFSEHEIDDAIEYANKKDITTQEQQEGFANALENIKRRNAILACFLSILTGGLYTIIWYMRTAGELKQHQNKAPSGSRSLLLVLPYVLFGYLFLTLHSHYALYMLAPLLAFVLNFVVFSPYVHSLTRLTKGNPGVLLVFLVLLTPFGVLATQEELNSRAHYK